MITRAEIENWFTYHDDPNKVPKYKAIREAAKYLAGIIVDNTPSGPDQSAAIRLLREAVMTANAAIACEDPLMGMRSELAGLNKAYNGEMLGQAVGTMAEQEPPEYEIRRLEQQLKRAHERRAGMA